MTVVATALGEVRVNELGVVLPHEHLFINRLREPLSASTRSTRLTPASSRDGSRW